MAWSNKKKEINNSEILRYLLFKAILQDDTDDFIALCNNYASLIVQYFDEWRQLPENIQHNQKAVNAWGHCLFTIASVFESRNCPELILSLSGQTEDLSITQWIRELTMAQQLSKLGKYEESNATLIKILTKIEGFSGNFIDEYRPKIYGLLGTNFLRINQFNEALQYTKLALKDCKRTGDKEGITIYKENFTFLLSADKKSIVAQYRKKIAKAQHLSDKMRYELSNTILGEVLADIEQNTELKSYRSKVYGLKGLNFFRLGALQNAKKYTELALHHCEVSHDYKGICIYKENLRVISETSKLKWDDL